MKNIDISISAGALLVIAAAYFFGAGQILLLMFSAAAIHELGHYAVLKLCGGRVAALRLEATGAVMRGEGLKSYACEFYIAAAGPMASMAFAVICAAAARYLQYDPIYRLAGMSLLFCLFNLLPIIPLDGGIIFYAAAARLFGLETAVKLSCAASCATLLFILSAGAYVLAVTKTNYTLLLAAVWLLVYYCKKGNNGIKLKGM